MANHHGVKGIVYAGGMAIAEVTAWSYTGQVTLEPTTKLGDAPNPPVTYNAEGPIDGNGSLTANYDPADATQNTLREGATVTLILYPTGTAGTKQFSGSVQIESFAIQGSNTSIVTASVNFRGRLTEEAVP